MSDEQALLAAIREHPDEDTPRLVYADWLDEQGGESNTARAEYIRLEIAHANNFPEQRWTKAGADAQKPAHELFAKHGRTWFPELYGPSNILRGTRAYPGMGRGFPFRLLCDSDKLLDVGERLLQVAPLTEVEFRNLADVNLRRLVRSPWVRGFRDLHLSGYSDVPDWSALADCPYFTEVVKLVPHGGYFDTAGAARVAAADPFPKLRRLSVSFRISDDGLAALFGGRAFSGLHDLSLSHPGGVSAYGIAGVRAVCASKALAGLKALDLRWRPMPDLTRTLTGATFWPGLEGIDLLRNNLGNHDLAEFLNTPSKLRRLELDDNKITAKGAKLLAEHPALANITTLDLSRNAIGDSGLAALVTSPHAKNLQKLEVSGCGFGLPGITALAASPYLANLRELFLHSNKIDLKGVRALAASPHLGGLTYLSFGTATVTMKKELKARFGSAVTF